MSIIPYAKAIHKWADKKEAAAKVAGTLLISASLVDSSHGRDQLQRRAERMANCSDKIQYSYCQECHSMHVMRTWLCRDRLCPICNWRLSLKRIGEMMEVLSFIHENGEQYNAAMLTLTIKNMKIEDLPEGIDMLLSGWRLLSLRRPFKKYVKGYCRSIEITKGNKGSWHPHIHALLFFDDEYNNELSTNDFVQMWQNSINADYTPICDIRRSYSRKNLKNDEVWDKMLKSTAEAIKYVAKDKIIVNASAEELSQINNAIASKMLVSYGGIIRKARAALRLKDNDSPDLIQDYTIECPKCGSSDILQLSYEWAQGDYLLNPIKYKKG